VLEGALTKITKFARHLRDEYFRRRRHGLIYYAILAALLVGVFGVLHYFKVSPIPKFPVPGESAVQAIGGQTVVTDRKTHSVPQTHQTRIIWIFKGNLAV
jgi:hypothetical protein